MKRFFVLVGLTICFSTFLLSQDSTFMTRRDFRIEKARLVESINKLYKVNQEYKNMLLSQSASLDSLAQVLDLQAEGMKANQDSLSQLQTVQSDLDDRLVTQRKSGTLIAILIPAGLFLLILILLIWMIVFKHHTRTLFNNLEEKLNELSKRIDDQSNIFRAEQDAIRSEIRSHEKEAESRLQKLSGETGEKLQNLKKLVEEEMAVQGSKHQESLKEYELFKGDFQKRYESFTGDLTSLKEELSVTTKGLAARIKEIIKKVSG